MQKITRIAALLLVVLAFVFAIAAFSLGRRGTQKVATPSPVTAGANPTDARASSGGTPVVVAASALAAGQPIPLSSLRVESESQPPQGSFGSADALAGSMPRVDIPAGAPITTALLARGLAMQLLPGERALAVPVDEVAGVGDHVLPGDYVDVFLSLKNPASAGMGSTLDRSQTRLLLSRLRVLAFGNRNLPDPGMPSGRAATVRDASQSATRSDETQEAARTAVLAVPVAEVDRLLLGAQNGKLSLALRYPGDDGLADDALFPQPPAVLLPRAGLSDRQRQLLAAPENYAFAGIDGAGLAGQAAAAPRMAYRRRNPALPGLEIIRGIQRDEAAHNAGSHSP